MHRDSTGCDAVHKAINELVEGAALERFASLTRRTDLRVQKTQGENEVFAPCMVVILVTAPDLRLTFKAHFKTNVARGFVAPLFQVAEHTVKSQHAIDLMREFCNLTGSAIKKELSEMGYAAGVSLPIVMRGLDELLLQNDRIEGYACHWDISAGPVAGPVAGPLSGQLRIGISSLTELYQTGVVSHLKVESEGGEI